MGPLQEGAVKLPLSLLLFHFHANRPHSSAICHIRYSAVPLYLFHFLPLHLSRPDEEEDRVCGLHFGRHINFESRPSLPSPIVRALSVRPGIDFVLRTFLDCLARVLWFWRDSRNLGQVGRRSPLLPSSCFISQLGSLRRPRVFRSLFHLFFFSLSLSLFPSVGMEANDGSRMQKADDERCSFVRFRPLSRL